jgi:DNA-directed RNA polymerase subunit RPC12/RpoP
MDEDNKEIICPECGLRSYNEVCVNCGTLIVNDKEDKEKEDEEEEYDWREKHR